MPPYRRKLLALLVAGVVVVSFREDMLKLWPDPPSPPSRVQLVDAVGAVIPMAGRADVFALDRSRFMASPLPLLGSLPLAGLGDTLELSPGRFPKSINVRFHVPGHGVDFASVELHKPVVVKLELSAPISVTGVVTARAGPVAGARVLALAPSPRGVVVAEAETDGTGRYTLLGISGSIDFIVLRILAAGYAMEEREHWRHASAGAVLQVPGVGRSDRRGPTEAVSDTDFELTSASPVRGIVEFREPPPPGADRALTISVLDLPGVTASVDPDGRFSLDHLSGRKAYRVLIQGLPKDFTHDVIHVRPGQACRLAVVPSITLRGQIWSRRHGRGVRSVEIWHRQTTRGGVRALTDVRGRFVLSDVPVGRVSLQVIVPAGELREQGFTLAREFDVQSAADPFCKIEIE